MRGPTMQNIKRAVVIVILSLFGLGAAQTASAGDQWCVWFDSGTLLSPVARVDAEHCVPAP